MSDFKDWITPTLQKTETDRQAVPVSGLCRFGGSFRVGGPCRAGLYGSRFQIFKPVFGMFIVTVRAGFEPGR